MNLRTLAKALGRRGGQARARRLSTGAKKKIAALGGLARARSVQASRHVAHNFQYVHAMKELSGATKRGMSD